MEPWTSIWATTHAVVCGPPLFELVLGHVLAIADSQVDLVSFIGAET
jgi:hypothetical protein